LLIEHFSLNREPKLASQIYEPRNSETDASISAAICRGSIGGTTLIVGW
jgi:hypothetical protein